jgi:hypothetical protein
MPARALVARTSACTLIALGVAAAPASAEIVKAPTGEKSRLHLDKATVKRLKKTHTRITAIRPAKKSKNTLVIPYNLARWDFTTHEGDVAHYAKHTGWRFTYRHRKAAMTHPRLVMDSPTKGEVEALISNVRVKVFTVSAKSAKVGNTATSQDERGLRLKLTQAGADYVNKALHHKSLKRFSRFGTIDLHLRRPAGGTTGTPGQGTTPGATATAQPGFLSTLPGGSTIAPGGEPAAGIDSNGDGQPDTGVVTLPLSGGSIDATTKTGDVKLAGGLAVNVPSLGTSLTLMNPEVVLGSTPDASGLYAEVNGVRLKVGDLDTNNLDLDVANGTVTVKGLKVTVSGAAAPVLRQILGTPLIQSGTPLLSLDLSTLQL